MSRHPPWEVTHRRAGAQGGLPGRGLGADRSCDRAVTGCPVGLKPSHWRCHERSTERLCHRRRRLRGQRAREPAQRRPGQPGAGARGWPAGLPVRCLHPHAGRPDLPDRQQVLRLEVRVGAGAVHERAQDLSRPRQGARRVEQHQRDDLPARQPARLRALGGRPGHEGVGLRALPAVFQEDGDLPGRGREMARPRRAARARTRARDEPAVPGLLRGGAAGRVLADRRRQRLPAGRLRAVRPQRSPRQAAVRRPRLPASGHGPAESSCGDPGVRDQDLVRRHAARSAWSTGHPAEAPGGRSAKR